MSAGAAPSLQRRLLGLVLGMVAGVWLLSAVATWFDVQHELRELLDGHLAQAAALLVAQQAEDVGESDHRVDAPNLHKYAPRVAFQVWHEGRLAMRSANAPQTPMIPAERGPHVGFASVPLDGAEWRVFTTRGAAGDMRVYVGERAASRSEILIAVLRSTLWPMALALPILALAVWWAVRRGLQPLQQLGASLAQRAPDALQPVPLDGVPADIAPVITALNGLFARITTLVDAERRFTADAAHELRTPIAAVRTQAQVALGEADDGARRHALQATIEGCDRATRLVEQLLQLARLEAGAAPALQAVDLAGIARGVVGALAPQAVAQDQQLELEAPPAGVTRGDEALLRALLRNLVDNAVRYAGRGARIVVQLQADGTTLRLRVADSGPGLAEAELARLGERFFRVLGHAAPGSGLGWSIARRIAAVHGATLHAGRSAELGGLDVLLELPAG